MARGPNGAPDPICRWIREDRDNAPIGCLVLFLLPFAGTGIFLTILALRAALSGDLGQALSLTIFALVFGGVGIGGIFGVVAIRRKLSEVESLKAGNPGSPWLWRKDWASGRIEDAGLATMLAEW